MVLKYYVNQVTFDQGTNYQNFDKETWYIGEQQMETAGHISNYFLIKTPHGNLMPSGVKIISEGPQVGLEFKVTGCFHLDHFNCPSDGFPFISYLALVRQPHNAWLWAHLLDKDGNTLATFCGYDEINGLAELCAEIERMQK